MGRHKEPSALKKLRGSEPRYINEDAPDPGGAPVMPRGVLGRHGRKFWRDHAGQLVDLGILTSADGGAFLALCQSYELMLEAWAKVQAEGVFRQDENNVTRKHPGIQVWRDALTSFLKLAAQFGLTPVAREGLNIEAPAVDEYEVFLNGHG